jgi:tetratricopeptide (TPR) repeat protein
MFIAFMRTTALAVALIVASVAGPVHAEWRKAETAHFIVYGDVSERTIRTYAQKAERFDSLLRAYYPIENEYEIPKLEIYIAEGRRDMERAYPGIPASIGGYYSPNSGRIHAVVDTEALSGDVVLFHEYAHHFMFQMRSNAYPSWFVEGFAEYYATADIRPDRIQFGRHLPGRINSLSGGANTWAPMEDVLTWRYTASGRYRASSYYAQAWAMTHYFMSTPERTRMLGQYLAAIVRGEESVAAMQAATGRTPAQLQNDVRLYVSGPINVLTPQIEIPEPAVTVSSLTPAEGDMAWLDLRLDTEPVKPEPPDEDGLTRKSEAQKAREAREEAEHRAELIRSAFAAAARRPGDRMAMLVEARAHRLSGDQDAAFDALEPLLGQDSADADALRLAGMLLLDLAETETDATAAAGRRRAALGYLARAVDADPMDFRIYLGLNSARQGLPGYPNDNDVTTLEMAALALAPQSFEARLRLGQAYMVRSMNAEAVTVLQPVANSPHRSRYTRQARAMIAAARGEAAPLEEAPPEEGEGAAAGSE